MDGRFPHQVPPQLGTFYTMGAQNIMPPEIYGSTLPQFHSMPLETATSYPSDYEEPSQSRHSTSVQPRQRRRQSQNSDHVKHRRTRSGCYTCRQRRVKCDENRPICNRCSKGKRECNYPEPVSLSRKSLRTGVKRKGSPSTSHSSISCDEEEADADYDGPLHTIADDEDELGQAYDFRNQAQDDQYLPTSVRRNRLAESSPVSEIKPPRPRHRVRPNLSRQSSSRTSGTRSMMPGDRSRRLAGDIDFYLRFHREQLSHHHYALKCDGAGFLKTTLIEIAMDDDSDALLHGIVAFSAYHYAIQCGEGRLSPFLSYYNKSISLLQRSLRKQRHTVATLLTILQLATIEEFLGDWVTLLGHQKAAHQILTNLFTPETIMQNETRRNIMGWYFRFDLFAGMLSGDDTVLGRQWAAAAADFYIRAARDRPNDLGARFEENFASSRLLAADLAALFAARNQNAVSKEQFDLDVSALRERFDGMTSRLETSFTDPSCFVQDFSGAIPPLNTEVVDFREPGFLYTGDLFTMNYILSDFWAIDLMFKHQMAEATGEVLDPDALRDIALKKCKMFEAIECSGQGPPGAVLGCQASLGMMSLYLPKEKQYIDWCRRKFVAMEQHGYIYPATLRQRMSSLWGEDVSRWWLPNDEGFTPIISALREFIQFRNLLPRDAWAAKVRDMRGIFKSLDAKEGRDVPEGPHIGSTDSEHFESPEETGGQWESSPDMATLERGLY